MRQSNKPVSPLRQRMIEDMTLRKLNPRTQTQYIRAVVRLSRFLGQSPDQATVEDLRRFQLHLAENGVSNITINTTLTGLKFFFTHTLDQPELLKRIQRVHQPRKIPEVLSVPSLIFMETLEGDITMQGVLGNNKHISFTAVLAKVLLGAFSIILIASTLVFAPVWVIGRMLGKPNKIAYPFARVLSLVTALLLLGSLSIPGISHLPQLGMLNSWSVGYFVTSLSWAVLALASLVYVALLVKQKSEVGVLVWTHSLLASIAACIAAGYMGYYGLIGLQLWAY